MQTHLASTVQDGWKTYGIPDAICRAMLKQADEALANCFPHDSKSKFAVSLLTAGSNMYQGVSYSSDTGTLTMHSEATALAHAAVHSEHEVIALTGPNCHICKQLLWENAIRSKIDIMVVMVEGDRLRKVPISQLMPYPWPDGEGTY